MISEGEKGAGRQPCPPPSLLWVTSPAGHPAQSGPGLGYDSEGSSLQKAICSLFRCHSGFQPLSLYSISSAVPSFRSCLDHPYPVLCELLAQGHHFKTEEAPGTAGYWDRSQPDSGLGRTRGDSWHNCPQRKGAAVRRYCPAGPPRPLLHPCPPAPHHCPLLPPRSALCTHLTTLVEPQLRGPFPWSPFPYFKLRCMCSILHWCLTLRPHWLWPIRLLCPRDFPGRNIGIGCHFLLQGIFLTQGSCHHSLSDLLKQSPHCSPPLPSHFGILTPRCPNSRLTRTILSWLLPPLPLR